ncbi:MAG: hypothetical protein VYE29_04975 [Pseudomonadota bacterium]|nr:hypothetical protein [Pseudomonadota bacterium]
MTCQRCVAMPQQQQRAAQQHDAGHHGDHDRNLTAKDVGDRQRDKQ